MKIYRRSRDGIGIWRLSGIVDRDDAYTLMHSLRESGALSTGCFILDFEDVDHIDYRVVELIESWFPAGSEVLFSGLNDYVLNIFAFAGSRADMPIFADWRTALQYLLTERGKLSHAGLIGSSRNA
jgi:hypothetical protein